MSLDYLVKHLLDGKMKLEIHLSGLIKEGYLMAPLNQLITRSKQSLKHQMGLESSQDLETEFYIQLIKIYSFKISKIYGLLA